MHSLEGCFLKSFYKGQLLVAMAKDGNNYMLPLAWAVVEKENKNSWTVFLKCIRDVGLGEGGGLTLTTDMQKVYDLIRFVFVCTYFVIFTSCHLF